jgi:hypothetical protein
MSGKDAGRVSLAHMTFAESAFCLCRHTDREPVPASRSSFGTARQLVNSDDR